MFAYINEFGDKQVVDVKLDKFDTWNADWTFAQSMNDTNTWDMIREGEIRGEHHYDKVWETQYRDRIYNGRRLFAKYYDGLWD